MDDPLTPEEQKLLLELARQAIQEAVCGNFITPLDLTRLTPRLQEIRSSFVTLTIQGELRGCIGSLESYQPFVEDVREHAVAAALQDYRFPPVCLDELSKIRIEISRLTAPCLLCYDCQEDLPAILRPEIDGVVLRDGLQRATFLPQVWSKIPDPEAFLNQLCLKLDAAPNIWRLKKLEVYTYQVEVFHE